VLRGGMLPGGVSTLAAKANQRVRILHARPHLLWVHARQHECCFTEESVSFMCCMVTLKRLVLAIGCDRVVRLALIKDSHTARRIRG